MKMIYLLISLLSFSVLAQEFTGSFVVTITDQNIRVTSPKKKIDTVSVIVKNDTFEDIRSELSSEKGVIKRFNLKSQSSKSIEISFKKIKTLFYVSIAPPFQAVELKFSQRPYAIPPKK